ncbi:MAG: RagB/SusD family nutrient uptake outer membrane protein [Bacteroidota bacterium]|nr:RagB/SusD family nutrient uptake outer membrane protein [Bacteroidota bacterium]
MKMKKYFPLIYIITIGLLITSCNKLDTKIDTSLTDKNVATNYNTIWSFGYAPYTYLTSGFYSIDNNLFAAVSDEAEQTASTSNTQLFNQGSWNAYNNPDNVYSHHYKAIRAANYFLENSTNYKSFLALNRDTISDRQRQYKLDVQDVAWLRNESHVLRAYYYFDLAKRYGGVPLVKKTLLPTDNTDLPRANFDDIINYVVSEIDAVKDSLQVDWKSFDVSKDGRITKGAALAIKSRALLYAASPLHNPTNDVTKWQKAASAAHDVIALNQYSLANNYQNLFIIDNTVLSPETIWAIRIGASNDLEKKNYPIGTPGGSSGVTPSQNLVSAYEYTGIPDPANPYTNRDPRLGFSIVKNNDSWNGRTIQTWIGGTDAWDKTNTSKTGYYLKKFLNTNLNLVNNQSNLRSWIVFRYGEILLNYAEAMNEAYGPDNDNGWGMTARQAINAVRNRTGVAMPAVIAANQTELRDKIKLERRIELAFEDHRYWDLLRWKDAENVLNQPLKGVKATKNADNSFSYSEYTVEKRVFIAPKMYYYPIPQTEISKSKGIMKQNPEW